MKFQNTWTTFNGKEVSYDTVDHQHLSNIYWFHRIIWEENDTDFIDNIKRVASNRFNGQILPYRPHIDFKMEIDNLRKLGLLENVWEIFEGTVKLTKHNIVHQGKTVGEIIYSD